MINLEFVLSLSMILFIFLIDTPQVVGSLMQKYNQLNDPTKGYDLDEGPVIYQAYYPDDDENLERAKKLIYREPLIENSWQIHYGTRAASTSHVNSRNSDDQLLPLSLHQFEDNRIVDNNRRGAEDLNPAHETQTMEYKQRVNDAFNILVDALGNKVQNSIDEGLLLNNLRNQNRFIAKNYIEYWKLANALAREKTYSSLPQIVTAQSATYEQSIGDTLSQENIFQPRPQVINYKFSPSVKGLEQSGSSSSAKIHEHDRVGVVMQHNEVSNLSQQPLVESIKVEGKPVHKIRHHHGEKRQKKL